MTTTRDTLNQELEKYSDSISEDNITFLRISIRKVVASALEEMKVNMIDPPFTKESLAPEFYYKAGQMNYAMRLREQQSSILLSLSNDKEGEVSMV